LAKRDRRICSLHWRRCTIWCHRRFFLLPASRIPRPAGTIRVLVRPICCGRLQGRFARLVCAYRHKAPFTFYKEFCSVCRICVRYKSINKSSSAATSSRPFIALEDLPELNADGTIFAGSELAFLAAMDSRRLGIRSTFWFRAYLNLLPSREFIKCFAASATLLPADLQHIHFLLLARNVKPAARQGKTEIFGARPNSTVSWSPPVCCPEVFRSPRPILLLAPGIFIAIFLLVEP
jgi:hypothetical protein